LLIEINPAAVKCQACSQQWTWSKVEDFTRFFVICDPESIAKADDQVISWAIDRTMDHMFKLLTPESCAEIVESIYGPNMSPGVKEIFVGQVEDVLAALRAHAVATVSAERANIVAPLHKRSGRIM